MGFFFRLGHPIFTLLNSVIEGFFPSPKRKLIQLIKLPKIKDDANLVFGQTPDQIPFPIKRIYYIYEAKPNLARGKHAHHQTQQILFCLRGSVRMVLDDGKRKKECVLNQPEVGIFLDKMVWHEMLDMNKNTILLVLASDIYKEKDYIRDYNDFKTICGQRNK